MTSTKEIGVGVVGLGYMGRTHVTAYRDAAADGVRTRLVAVCDANPALAGGDTSARGNLDTGRHAARLFDPRETSFHRDPAELFALPAVDLVSICTHTRSHVELATQALEAGKHVLVEKPVALSAAAVERLLAAARAAGRLCMPAMCVRFWPGWDWLRATVRAGTLGEVRSAVFRRIAAHPGWAPEFYRDPHENGGALFDLHVHDADFVRWCFGPPAAVTSTGTIDHLTTLYRYLRGPAHVVAEGGWDLATGFEFVMSFTVAFAEATADYRLGRTPPLLLCRDGKAQPVALAPGNGYEGEVRHALALLTDPDAIPLAPLEDAVGLTRMLEAEGESLRTGATVAV
ncbi:MAG: Gfo/Idh/MocA family oxidoreductase [Planctomycetota bacterium]